jgi:hypothetical protein
MSPKCKILINIWWHMGPNGCIIALHFFNPTLPMKKLFFALFLVTGVLMFQSCQDDDKKSPSNELSYGGEKIKIVTILRDMDPEVEEGQNGQDVYFHELYLLSAGFTYDTENLYGEGDALHLTALSNSPDNILAGVYSFGIEALLPGFMDAELYMNYNADNETSDAVHHAESGTMTIDKDGGEYTITFSLMLDGKSLTGTYRGQMTEFTP